MIHLFKNLHDYRLHSGVNVVCPLRAQDFVTQYTQYRYDMAPGKYLCLPSFRLDMAETMKDLAPSPSLCNSKTNMVRRW